MFHSFRRAAVKQRTPKCLMEHVLKSQFSDNKDTIKTSLPRPRYIGDCVLFSIDFFVYVYLSFFLSLLARLQENGWTDFHEIFREGAEWPWDDVIQFWVNSEKPRDANFLVSNSACKQLDRFAWNFHGRCGVTMGWPDYIFGQFRKTARCCDAQHGSGVCCALAPQLVSNWVIIWLFRRWSRHSFTTSVPTVCSNLPVFLSLHCDFLLKCTTYKYTHLLDASLSISLTPSRLLGRRQMSTKVNIKV